MLIVTSAVSNLIREAKTFQIPSMMQVGKAVGMVTLNDALMDLVTKKLVAPKRPTRKPSTKRAFEALLLEARSGTSVQGRHADGPPVAVTALDVGLVARSETAVLYSSGSVGARTPYLASPLRNSVPDLTS